MMMVVVVALPPLLRGSAAAITATTAASCPLLDLLLRLLFPSARAAIADLVVHMG
jgi:predicted solute-binding protein